MPAPAALEVIDLVVTYDGRRVVDDLTFQAEAGRITAVLGPNGAGKTTTIECAEGLRRPASGTIRVLGHAPGSTQARARTGVMLQDGGLPMARSVRDVLALACAVRPGARSPRELVDLLDLAAVERTPVRRLSGGQRQRLAFAVAIAARPDLAFLDEPSAGLDPHARRDVWSLVRDLRESGTAVVLTTHLLQEAEELADVVHVLDRGRLVAAGTPQDLVARYAATDTLQITFARRPAPGELAALGRAAAAGAVERDGDAVLVRDLGSDGPHVTARVAAWCADAGLAILTLRAGGGTLEHAYLALTGRHELDDAGSPGRPGAGASDGSAA